MSDLSSWFTPGAPTNAPGAGQGSVASWFPAAPSTAAATPGAVGLPPAVAQFLQQLGVLPGGVPSATTGGAPGTTLAPLSPTVVPGETLAEFIARLRRGRDVAPEPPNPQLPGTDTGGSGGGTESFSAAPGTSFADMTGPQAVGTQALNTSNITGLASGAMQGNTTGTLMSLAGLMGLSPNTGNAVADAAINTAIGQILGHMLPSMPSAPGAGLALGGMNLF